jgi:hypothetical protein
VRLSLRSLVLALVGLLAACQTSSYGAAADPADASADAADAGEVAAPCPNGALQFDGRGFVNVAFDPTLDSPSDLTVEAWILPDASIGSSAVDIVSHHDEANSDGWVLRIEGGLVFRVYAGPGAGNAAEARDPSLTLGQWHHVAAVFEGATKAITLFIDGRTSGRTIGDKTKADPYSGPLAIGAAAYRGAEGFIGIIDEVRVSRTVRYTNGALVKPAYPLPDNEPGTLGTWHFASGKPANEVANEATGRFTSTLSTFATPTPSYPVSVLGTCPTSARP